MYKSRSNSKRFRKIQNYVNRNSSVSLRFHLLHWRSGCQFWVESIYVLRTMASKCNIFFYWMYLFLSLQMPKITTEFRCRSYHEPRPKMRKQLSQPKTRNDKIVFTPNACIIRIVRIHFVHAIRQTKAIQNKVLRFASSNDRFHPKNHWPHTKNAIYDDDKISHNAWKCARDPIVGACFHLHAPPDSVSTVDAFVVIYV